MLGLDMGSHVHIPLYPCHYMYPTTVRARLLVIPEGREWCSVCPDSHPTISTTIVVWLAAHHLLINGFMILFFGATSIRSGNAFHFPFVPSRFRFLEQENSYVGFTCVGS
ncbi:unnamed protein product [Periconia digitata]|uniref:Uncharacterized protein n=1 Tax=Periconia digitata TaxID=1303443 RepID=A0A9W4UKV0_9PLEO|nr:unnamed protein product [Periconia digitata]